MLAVRTFDSPRELDVEPVMLVTQPRPRKSPRSAISTILVSVMLSTPGAPTGRPGMLKETRMVFGSWFGRPSERPTKPTPGTCAPDTMFQGFSGTAMQPGRTEVDEAKTTLSYFRSYTPGRPATGVADSRSGRSVVPPLPPW